MCFSYDRGANALSKEFGDLVTRVKSARSPAEYAQVASRVQEAVVRLESVFRSSLAVRGQSSVASPNPDQSVVRARPAVYSWPEADTYWTLVPGWDEGDLDPQGNRTRLSVPCTD
jgi:hypothetical protein